MRHTEVTTGGEYPIELAVSYPNSVAFMYSPQLVKIESIGQDPGAFEAAVDVVHRGSGRSHVEQRKFNGGVVTFDISRIMQLLASDVDTLFRRLHETEGASLCEQFSLMVSYRDPDGDWQNLFDYIDITAMYGALDQGEIYGEHNQRRLYVNFPQTFNLWQTEVGDTAFIMEDAYIYPDTQGGGPCHECDLVGAMLSLGELEEFKKMLPGRPQHNVGLTWRTRIERGAEIPEDFRTVTMVPDYRRPSDGTYLRWLNRRGEVSYGLFTNSQIRTASSANNSFSRYYDSDPSEPVAGAYTNAQKTDYTEVREMVIGAVGLSYDEYQDMCDLATSPLVERLMPDVPEEDRKNLAIFDGGDADNASDITVQSEDGTALIEAGDATLDRLSPEQYVWQRVNVVAGTFERNIRRNTPNRQDLEIIIRLPERNTIKL